MLSAARNFDPFWRLQADVYRFRSQGMQNDISNTFRDVRSVAADPPGGRRG
jgi:hypothetical protein